MVSYTAMFRAVADFSGAIREGQRLGDSFTRASKEADRLGPAGQTAAGKLGRGLGAAAQAMDKTGRSLTLGVSVPLVAVGVQAVRTFASFETAITSAGAKTNATAAQMEQMKKVALEVGSTTKFSGQQAAEGLDNLAAAGFNADDAIKTLPAVTLAAQAANEDLGLTALTTARAMNAFNIPVGKAAHVADVFSQASNNTALTMQGLQDALGQVGEVGNRYNQSLEDVIAVTGRLVDMGVPAASAGTAIRQALTSLAAPSAQAATLMHGLGIETRDATGNMLPLPTLIDNVSKGLRNGNPAMEAYKQTVGLSDEALKEWAKSNGITFRQAAQIRTAYTQGGNAIKDYATKTLFGVEGAKAFSLAMSQGKPVLIDVATETDKMQRLTAGLAKTLGKDGADAFIKAHTAQGKFSASGADAVRVVSALGVASDGTSAKIGAMFQETTAQKIDNLKGSLSTLAITLVGSVAPGLNDVTVKLTRFITGLADFASVHPTITKTALAILGVLAAVGPTLLILGKMIAAAKLVGETVSVARKAFQTSVAYIQLYGEAAAKAATQQGALSKGTSLVATALKGPWGAALAAATVVLGIFAYKHQQAKKRQEEFQQGVSDFGTVMDSLTGKITRNTAALQENVRQVAVNKLQTGGALDAADRLGLSLQTVTDAALGNKTAIGEVNRTLLENLRLNPQLSKGNSDRVKDATLLAHVLGLTSKQEQEAIRVHNQQQRALTGAGDAAGEAGKKFAGSAEQQRQAAEKAAQLSSANKQLDSAYGRLSAAIQVTINKFTILRKGALDSEEAEAAFQDSLDRTTESVKEHGHSLSENSSAGRANRAVIREQVRALAAKVDADVKAKLKVGDLTGAQKIARKETGAGEKAIRAAAKAAGLNTTEIDKMIKKYLKTPDKIETAVKANGVGDAEAEIKKLQDKIKALKDKKVKVSTEFKSNASHVVALIKAGKLSAYADGGEVQARANGGMIRGRGGPRQDNIAGVDRRTRLQTAWVSAKEFVVNARSTKKHRKIIEAVNQDRVPEHVTQSLANGGLVRRRVDVNADTTRLPNLNEIVPADQIVASKLGKDWATKIAAQVKAKFKALGDDVGSGLIGGKGFKSGLAFARRQAGKPYIWASAGPRGYDCSGFMSAIANVVQGKNPYRRRFSTGQAGGRTVGGFTRGKNSAFRIGVWKNNPGHTAGTINGVNVESRGGGGVKIGRAARGANNRLFTLHYGLAKGGLVLQKPRGDAPFDLLAPQGELYNPLLRKVANELYRTNSYARGTEATQHGLSLTGEHGPELRREKSGSQILTSKKTLDYLSRIEALATKPPKQFASVPSSPSFQPAGESRESNVNITMPIYYPREDELPTMAAQRSIVRAGRAAFSHG